MSQISAPAAQVDPMSTMPPVGPGLSADRLTPAQAAKYINRGYKRLAPFRAARKAAYDSFLGRHYGQNPSTDVIGVNSKGNKPVNLTMQQVRTLLPYFAYTAGSPRVEAQFSNMTFEAKLIEAALTQDGERMNLTEKYQDRGIDAILSGVSMVITGIKAGEDVIPDQNKEIDPGQMFEEPLDFDDWAVDPDARREGEIRCEAYRTRASRAYVIDVQLFGREPEELQQSGIGNQYIATRDEAIALVQGMPTVGGKSQNQVSDASKAGADNEDDHDIIEVWNLCWYENGRTTIFILGGDPKSQSGDVALKQPKFLAAYIWDGRERGPIEKLWFVPVPNNVVPMGLESMQRDLALVADAMANKMIRQMLRAKTLPVVRPEATDLGMQAVNAKDGEMLVGDPRSIGKIDFVTQLPEMIQGWEFVMSAWNNVTGNAQLQSGQADIGETATAFSGLMAKVNAWTTFLQSRMEAFSTKCLKRRAGFFLNDPFIDRILPYRVGVNTAIRIPYNEEMRQGEFDDFTFKIRSYSQQVPDPNMQAQRMVEVFSQVIPAIVALAGIIDVMAAIRIVAEKFDIPELEQILLDPVTQQMNMAMQTLGPQPQTPLPSQKLAMGAAQRGGPQGPGSPAGNVQSQAQQNKPPGPRR